MPRVSLDTNLPASKIPNEFLMKCTQILSKTLDKRIRVSLLFQFIYNFKLTLLGSLYP